MDALRWYIPTGLAVLLLLLMLRKGAYRVSPTFFTYVAFGVCADVARFVVRNHRPAYYATYWGTEAVYCVLGILVMYEVFRAVLRNLDRKSWFRFLFPAVVIVGIALSLARAHAVPPRVSGLLVYIVTGEIAVRFVQVLAALLTLVPLFDLRGQRYHFGIAAGFGLYSTAALIVTTKVSDFGEGYKFLWSVVSVNAYSLAELVWIWAFASPRSETSSRVRAEIISDREPLPPAGKSGVPRASLVRRSNHPKLSV
jgi:hypothetical protein